MPRLTLHCLREPESARVLPQPCSNPPIVDDEIYGATFIAGTIKSSRLLWEFDARVVDGVVNGTALSTVGSSFVSGVFDLKVVDGAVNLVARVYDVASSWFRRLQVGYTQGYAMVMVFGAAVLLGIFYAIKL